MRVSGPAWGPWCESRKTILCGCILTFLLPLVSQTRAQDVAEVARQEKARKSAEQQPPQHVYTEDDLKKSVILTPEDQARVEARKMQQGTVRGEQNAGTTPKDISPATESLGEVARKYRMERAVQAAELAAEKKFTPFPYEVPTNPLASPMIPADPIAPPRPSVGSIAPSSPRIPAASRNGRSRISPFSPRPFRGNLAAPPASLVVLPAVPEPPALRASIRPKKSLRPSQVQTDPTTRIEVERGQSWWKLAEIYLGSGKRWQELWAMNGNADGRPDLLLVGSMVVVPATSSVVNRGLSPIQTKMVVVSKGDTLWSLARHYLGRGSAWGCLANANPQIAEYTRIAIGARLELPASEASPSCRSVDGGNLKR